MHNKKWITGIAAAAALVLGACGSSSEGSETAGSESGEHTLRIGASNVPHAEILEFVAPKLEEEGITLEIETYNDYVIPNVALDEGDIDANYFQTIPYFASEMEENGFDFVNMGSIHIEPLGAYSQDYTSLEDVPEGARILAPNSITDHARVVTILEAAGLVTLEEGVDKTQASFDDIVENPHNLQFEYDYDPALMPTMYEQGEGDVVFINSNFAVDNGLNPVEDAIALEDPTSPYANIVAARSEDEENEAIHRLVEELQTAETQDFILETWGGAVIPVTE